MFEVGLSFAGLAGVPILLVFAYRQWMRRVRDELPAWRNGLCASALLLLLFDWVCVAILEVPALVNARVPRPAGLTEGLLALSHLVCIVATVLAFALRRQPRLQVMLAGVLMFMSWPFGYV